MYQVVSAERYSEHWNMLKDVLTTLLTKAKGSYKSISYEVYFSAVYHCVSRQHGERLYTDLTAFMREHVVRMRSNLMAIQNEKEFVTEFHRVLSNYFYVVGFIVPIFTFLNRLYVEPKLNTTINASMLFIFFDVMSNRCFEKLFGILALSHDVPFFLPPYVMQSIVKDLHALNPTFAKLYPSLFAKFVVGIQSPMTLEDLSAQQHAEGQLRESLIKSGYKSGDSSRKRRFQDEDN